MPHWRLFYHIVWGTKGRLPLIDPTWENDLYVYIWGKATALECIPHAIGGISNYIHVAISIPPKYAVATVIGQIKGASSHHINENYAVAHSLGKRNTELRAFRRKLYYRL